MRKFSLIFASCALVTLLAASPAQANVLKTLNLSEVNELEDTDYESHIFDAGDDSEIKDGDILLAILEVDKNNTITGLDLLLNGSTSSSLFFDYSESTSNFTGVSLVKVDGDPTITGGGENANYRFKAPTPAEWLTHTGLAAVDTNVMIVTFNDPPGSPHIDENAASVAAAVATATNGTRLWEFGLDGTTDTFWTAETEDDFLPDPDGGGPIPAGANPTRIDSITDLDFLASLNVIDDNGLIAGGLELDKHGAMRDPDMSGFDASSFTADTQLQLQGGLQSGSSGVFDIKTDTNFYLKPTPEPASVLVWAGLAGVGFGLRRRRMKKTSA